ncbi:unnamed protein product, partial [Callosobruchus maculatus]
CIRNTHNAPPLHGVCDFCKSKPDHYWIVHTFLCAATALELRIFKCCSSSGLYYLLLYYGVVSGRIQQEDPG